MSVLVALFVRKTGYYSAGFFIVIFYYACIYSPVQFFLTDSTQHFFRAALYYNNVPNADSLAPVNEVIRRDIHHLIESFRWQ